MTEDPPAAKSPPPAKLTPRGDARVPVLDQPPIGHLQALILKTLDDLGSEAFGYNVLETLSIELRVWIDHAQIYGAIRRLEVAGMIVKVEERKQSRAPPLKIYRLTATGHTALRDTAEHHAAMAAFLTTKHTSATPRG
jgi:DNA-binding PadR family transcriptional regulator